MSDENDGGADDGFDHEAFALSWLQISCPGITGYTEKKYVYLAPPAPPEEMDGIGITFTPANEADADRARHDIAIVLGDFAAEAMAIERRRIVAVLRERADRIEARVLMASGIPGRDTPHGALDMRELADELEDGA